MAPNTDSRSSIDTSRPFRSVKEAVAIFGEHLLAGELHSRQTLYFKHDSTPPIASQAIEDGRHDNGDVEDDENGEKQGLVSTVRKLAVELEETKVELSLLKERGSETEVALASLNAELHKNMSRMAQSEAAAATKATARRSEGSSRTLAQILSISEKQGERNYQKERLKKKKKPIIPLVSDLFAWRKGPSTTLHNPLLSSSQLYL